MAFNRMDQSDTHKALDGEHETIESILSTNRRNQDISVTLRIARIVGSRRFGLKANQKSSRARTFRSSSCYRR